MTSPTTLDELLEEWRELGRTMADLADRVGRLEEQADANQAGHTSLEDRELRVYDRDARERQRIGPHEDGRFTWSDRNGPPPPRPEPASLFAMPGGWRGVWNGGFDGGELPSDHRRVDVHVSLTDGFTHSDGTRAGTIESPRGAAVNFLTDDLQPHYVKLVAVTTSGAESEPSEQRSVTPLEAGGGVTTFYQETEPPDPDQGDLWVDKADRDGDGNPDNIMNRWDGAGWVTVRDEGINQAIQDAAAAQTDAADAIDAAADAQATADAKVTTFYQEAEPTATGTGDMWVKDSTGQLHRWDGSAWQPFQDEEIAQAINDAANAQNTADSKIVSYFQDAEPDPSQVDLTVGDIWYKTNAGNRQHWWGGSSWSEAPVGTAAISPGAVTTEVLAGGSVDNPALADEAVDDRVLRSLIALTSRLLAGDPTGARVELNGSGLEVYDSGGNRRIFFDGSDGSGMFTGQVATSESGQRVVLDPSGRFGQPSVLLYSGSGAEPGLLYAAGDSDGWFYSPRTSSSESRAHINLRAGATLSDTLIALNESRQFHGLDYGYSVQDTDSNGQISIFHLLGMVPEMVQLTLRAADGNTYAQHVPAQTDVTNIVVQLRNVADGSPLGGGNTTGIYYFAIV